MLDLSPLGARTLPLPRCTLSSSRRRRLPQPPLLSSFLPRCREDRLRHRHLQADRQPQPPSPMTTSSPVVTPPSSFPNPPSFLSCPSTTPTSISPCPEMPSISSSEPRQPLNCDAWATINWI